MKTLLIVIVALLIIVGGVYAYRATTAPSNGNTATVACTMEARLCPDGTYVGRVGPNCEFAACPSSTVIGSTTSTSTNGSTTSTTTTTVKIKY